VAPVEITEIRELHSGETRCAHGAMSALRPVHDKRDEFVQYVDEVLRPGGYRLVGSFGAGNEQALAAAGFRVADSLAWGHHLYVDDLSTVLHARGQGHARAVLVWLMEEGRRLSCAQLHLSSVVGPSRFDAHRFYYNAGLGIYAHHFACDLAGEPSLQADGARR
jgi:GNAT superfamily N-acetyltransferase